VRTKTDVYWAFHIMPNGSRRWICASITTIFIGSIWHLNILTGKDVQLWTETNQDLFRRMRTQTYHTIVWNNFQQYLSSKSKRHNYFMWWWRPLCFVWYKKRDTFHPLPQKYLYSGSLKLAPWPGRVMKNML